ncbi:MAG: bifunctional phosphopantothenoylcysteine decarboxylase/phosphopantothenate--cysteine ligase CoaBC [Bacteroidales bacterium]|nr:bifunctional phosphopantothenoylcysteine decarboxylase/phosphopantothenate--cysteine ligase CoaBC [Bacteroidales bacterium]MBO7284585.1 bifunctional phosphopantothenoylcysteine decarboxylase/phosphopantothenate--cysteine ligase CoaBC [Bacteroidales bacterium]MBO7322369.1 bifunctional phosphopantothenoylcysteine decarboxylase/phosphopantothenate--cysteine ligase CoaBC [Bacteroidales bacterium]
MLKGKHIIVGVTGSIAAYKTAILVRALVKEGAEVKVIMTETAKKFITPLTLATLSKNPVLVEFFDPENGQWNSHVSLGLWADMFLIAPVTASTLAKMAYGVADNLLVTTYLSSRCPVFVAPAMDLDMFAHPSTQKSLEILRERGVTVVEPAAGELASGLDGKGRMEEPEKIVEQVIRHFSKKATFSGKRVLITSGPTREPIDPVRYLTNNSSGKMATAIAQELAFRGASVTVVSGPAAVKPKQSDIQVIDVVTAEEMYQATIAQYEQGADIVVLCAAVADYTPAQKSSVKMKKKGDNLTLELLPTKDIAACVGKIKRDGDILVGFALETDNEFDNAQDKLARKNLDMIVLNSLRDEGAGFAGDTNKVNIFFKNGEKSSYPLKSKQSVAIDIVDSIEGLLGDVK